MTKQTNHLVHQGEIIFFSRGEYSDYGYEGQMIFTKGCDLRELADQYKAEYKQTYPEWEYDDYMPEMNFVSWLVTKEYCLPLQCREIHIGSYGILKL